MQEGSPVTVSKLYTITQLRCTADRRGTAQYIADRTVTKLITANTGLLLENSYS